MFRIGPLEDSRSLGDQFDELASEFRVSAFGVLVPGQVAAQLANWEITGHAQPLTESSNWGYFGPSRACIHQRR